MLYLFLALAIMSALDLVGGVIWLFALKGRWRRRSGPEVGAEIMAGQMEEEGVSLGQAFRGQGVSAEGEVELSFAEIKQMLKARRPAAIPALLALSGLLGLALFGALALWLAIEDRLVGTLILIVMVYGVIRAVIGLVRAQ